MGVEITKMSSRGQVVIPLNIRKNRNIKEGERFIVYDLEDSIVLKRVKNLEGAKSIDEFEETFSSMWETAKRRGITKRDVALEIQKSRKENA
ncbi:AbrB/MazE/SpoVT family DNA-binding domain-containing protein [Candidatus Woesearchaeota archaeon]|nr:AbrB/MazE/SpoVT family DNA-binding domain-containing protein [Candidatus Woesearchaeota archaeon]